MIQYLTGEEKQKCRDLWEEAFPEDSKEFDDYYFDKKLRDNRILAAVEPDGYVQSMIQLNPYKLNVRGLEWQADYLVGVSTRKDRRHQGFMRRLLQKMMEDMRKEQVPFCFLMPADEAIYRPFGFTYIYRQPRWKLRGDRECQLERAALIPWHDTELQRQKLSEAAAWLNSWLSRQYDLFAVRDEAYLSRLIHEIASENGTLELLYDQRKLVGMVSEWGWHEREQRLLYAEHEYVEEADIPKPAIMARIISPEAFARAVHLRAHEKRQEVNFIIKICDPLIEENDGMWSWKLDHHTSQLKKADSGNEGVSADFTVTITELTAWLCGYEVPEAAGRFAELVEPLENIFLDEVV